MRKMSLIKKNSKQIISIAQDAILHEANAIKKLSDYINEDFVKSVELVYQTKGRVIITGIGKSANIASKIVATLNSTGTPALFMHAADAIHGDLGMIQPDDVIICISKSGNTPEIKVLVPFIKMRGNKLIAIVSNVESFLAINADFVLPATVEKEACPNNLAPTSSTTAQLVIGDALAIALIHYRDFTSSDFAKYHPGGALGKKLYLRVEDIYKNNPMPVAYLNTSINDVIIEISQKRLGACVVVDDNKHVLGIVTDGDLRRMLQSHSNFSDINVKDIMSVNPKLIENSEMAVSALHIMEENNITQLIVVDNEIYVGIIHLHDLLKEGLV